VGRFVTAILDRLVNPPLIYVVQKFRPELLKDVLEREMESNCVVRAFSDPKEPLQGFGCERRSPDLLITGLVLEGMGWMQPFQECKKLRPSLKVIVFSSMLRADFAACFENKPFKPDAWISRWSDQGMEAVLAETQELLRLKWPND
jgi:hypothetical protein